MQQYLKNFPWQSVSRFFLYITPFALVIVTKSTLFPFIVGKYVWFRGSVALALIFFLLGLLLDWESQGEYAKKIVRVIKTPLGMMVTAFTAFFVIAGMVGMRPGYSFWSNFERGEGGFQMLFLYAFFLLLTVLFQKESEWRKFLWCVLWVAILSALYGIGAGLGYKGFIGIKFGEPAFRFAGSLGNPSYHAVFMLFASLYGIYILLTRYKKYLWNRPGSILIWLFFVVYMATFLLAATRGAFMGLGAGVFVALAYLGWRNKKWRKWAASIAIVLGISGALLVSFRNMEFVKSIPGSRIFDISFTAQTFEHRTIMWGIAWESFKERPLLGWGPENFGVLFQEHFNPKYFNPQVGMGAWFDRAHNIVFDYLAETGILGTLSWLFIFVCLYWNLLQGRAEKQGGYTSGVAAVLLAMPTAYLVQGIVLFDILPTYLNLFMFFGFVWFVLYKNQYEKHGEK